MPERNERRYMARAISDEELQLRKRARRRLIGAVVLVLVIVVVLPMVLDTEPRPTGQPVPVQIPSLDSGPFSPKGTPSTEAPKPPVAQAERATDAGKKAVSTAQPVRSEPAAVRTPVKATVKAPVKAAQAPGSAAAPAAPGERYVVQVIALADADRAKKLQQKIAAAGIESYTEVVKTQKGDVTRVRAGPFASRDAAEKAREQLRKLGMSGNITSK